MCQNGIATKLALYQTGANVSNLSQIHLAASRLQCTVALAFELDASTTEAHLLPVGPFRTVDGRPRDCAAWTLDATIAERVIARQAQRINDTLIDFEHQSIRSVSNGKRVEAAGWFRQLEWREGLGLYAVGIAWVGDTAELIAAKKLRYVSAVFTYLPETGEVVEIISVGLTNTPALDGLDALAALARLQSPEEETMPITEAALAALTAERDTLKTSTEALTAELANLKTANAALTTERDTLKVKVDAADQEKAQAALATEKSKHAELLTAALNDGRIAPALKPWAEKQGLAALTEYLDTAAPLPNAGGRQGGAAGDPADGLTAEERAMCTRLGVTAEDYAKTKAGK